MSNIIYLHRTRGIAVEGVHIREVVRALEKMGHSVKVTGFIGTDPLEEKSSGEEKTRWSPARFLWRTISRHSPQMVFELLEILSNLYTIFNLSRDIKKQNGTDFIYERYAMFGIAGVLAARRSGIPLILEVNDATFIDRIRDLKLKRIARLMEKYVFRKSDAIVTISTHFKKLIAETGIPEEKIVVIPNAANPETFSPTLSPQHVRDKYGIGDKLVIGYIGSMASYQKVDNLLSVADEITARHRDVVFLLVGDETRLDKKWRKYVNGDEKKIVFTGKVPHSDIPRYIAAMDIVALPHSNLHGSPMKIFEYMAMGKAIVAPKLPPLEDVLTDEVEAFLIEPYSTEELKDRIIELIENESLRSSFGRNAVEKIRSRHNWTKNTEKILSIYEGLSEKSAAKSILKTQGGAE